MKRVLDVGNCGFDHQSIRHLLEKHWPVTVERATTLSEAQRALAQTAYDLVLVNRIVEGDGGSGLSLVESLASSAASRPSPVILLTNYPEVQSQAIELGAFGSFGKREMQSSNALALLGRVLGETATREI